MKMKINKLLKRNHYFTGVDENGNILKDAVEDSKTTANNRNPGQIDGYTFENNCKRWYYKTHFQKEMTKKPTGKTKILSKTRIKSYYESQRT